MTEAIIDKQAVIAPEAVVGGQGPSTANRQFPTHLDGGQVLIGKAAKVPAGAVIERNVILFPEVDLGNRKDSHVRAGETISDDSVERRATDV